MLVHVPSLDVVLFLWHNSFISNMSEPSQEDVYIITGVGIDWRKTEGLAWNVIRTKFMMERETLAGRI